MRAQMRPRVSKKRATGVQETPKSAQKLPNSGPSVAKTRPRQARETPRPLRKRTRQVSRRVLAKNVIGSLVRQGAGTIFHGRWRRAHGVRSVLRPIKTVVLSHSEHVDDASAQACNKDEKYGPGPPKLFSKRPGTLQNRARSAPRRTKNGPARQQNATKARTRAPEAFQGEQMRQHEPK